VAALSQGESVLHPALAVSVSSSNAARCLVTPGDAVAERVQQLGRHIAAWAVCGASNGEIIAAGLLDLLTVLARAERWTRQQRAQHCAVNPWACIGRQQGVLHVADADPPGGGHAALSLVAEGNALAEGRRQLALHVTPWVICPALDSKVAPAGFFHLVSAIGWTWHWRRQILQPNSAVHLAACDGSVHRGLKPAELAFVGDSAAGSRGGASVDAFVKRLSEYKVEVAALVVVVVFHSKLLSVGRVVNLVARIQPNSAVHPAACDGSVHRGLKPAELAFVGDSAAGSRGGASVDAFVKRLSEYKVEVAARVVVIVFHSKLLSGGRVVNLVARSYLASNRSDEPSHLEAKAEKRPSTDEQRTHVAKQYRVKLCKYHCKWRWWKRYTSLSETLMMDCTAGPLINREQNLPRTMKRFDDSLSMRLSRPRRRA
jgi:hypothetical protein